VSRSNPSEHLSNPSTRWFEWAGDKGEISYYDKEAKKDVPVPLPFAFILLDELASVRGWHDASSSGIYSNEVRDTTQETLVVKSFKGGLIEEGKYKAIKLNVNAAGGDYNASLYIAFKGDSGDYAIGALRLKGAALGAWMEFRKAHRADIYKQAVNIQTFTEGKKGSITFRVPKFSLKVVSAEAEAMAVKLDTELQEFLKVYLTRNKRDQAEAIAQHPVYTEQDRPMAHVSSPVVDMTDDDIPF
jgi:hypothetical protein